MKRRLNKGRFLPILIIIILFGSCESEEPRPNLVETVGVLFTSSERVIIQGALLSSSTLGFDDFGVEVSLTENFESSIVGSLGSRNSLGRYIVEIKNLIPNTQYFARSYGVIDNQRVYGRVRAFETFFPRLKEISPGIADAGDIVTLKGQNLPDSFEVYFGDKSVRVDSRQFTSEIKIRVPERIDNFKVPVSLSFYDTTVVLKDSFEYVTGRWTKVLDWDENIAPISLYEAMYLQDKQDLVFGLGYDQSRFSNGRVFKVDMESFFWQELVYPGARSNLLSRSPYSLGNQFGGGRLSKMFGTVTLNQSYWEYSDDQFTRLFDLPFSTYKGVGMVISDKKYIFGGLLEKNGINVPEDELFQPIYDTYVIGESSIRKYAGKLGIVGEVSSDLPYFSLDGYAFFINRTGELFRLDVNSFSFEEKTLFPVKFSTPVYSQSVNDRAYVFGMRFDSNFTFEYNASLDEWRPRKPFPGDLSGEVVAIGNYNDKVYVVKIARKVDFERFPVRTQPLELWEFDPRPF